ncbi:MULTISPECIES: FMN-binding negative transcriptional regulator [unclassified Microbacterium]|uniref:FMN-binding negative transcriptional regulator n=1 Tax=unclassified Microbacterium TaxID=2609290 RepID=UPI001D80F515|nr:MULTISPECIES: FMN-binding negative transcriptional regulator [unclassified Microbacterium]CAH0159282.1 Protease synthase and sporulation protein PAI 2 [Microbacterium sp. Bi121]HWK78356.1 FMN-binding negative transcriptional regulator [Microbacterium sp.]
MRQNPSFAMTDVAELRRVIAGNPWATLVGRDADGATASHYAILLDPHRDDLTIVGHVGRPDDLVLGLGQPDQELLVVFQGPHGYISPGWYGDVPAVPTWNYVAVHLSGVPEILDADENLKVLEHLVEHFENRFPSPRGMWTPPNDETFVRRLESGTIGFRLTPTRVVAKRKLSQNKPDDVVENVILELSRDEKFPNPALVAEMQRAHDARVAARAQNA